MVYFPLHRYYSHRNSLLHTPSIWKTYTHSFMFLNVITGKSSQLLPRLTAPLCASETSTHKCWQISWCGNPIRDGSFIGGCQRRHPIHFCIPRTYAVHSKCCINAQNSYLRSRIKQQQHLLLNTQIPTYFFVHIFNANNPGNKTSPVPFSGSATLVPEWAVSFAGCKWVAMETRFWMAALAKGSFSTQKKLQKCKGYFGSLSFSPFLPNL